MAAEVDQYVSVDGGEQEYSDVNFAYGSTPIESWLKVGSLFFCNLSSSLTLITPWSTQQVIRHPLAIPEIESSMRNGEDKVPRICMVWGSSMGWIVFYSYLAFGWRTEGVEFLSCLHERAVTLQQEFHLEGEEQNGNPILN